MSGRGAGDFPISLDILLTDILPAARRALSTAGGFGHVELEDATGTILSKQFERDFSTFDTWNHALVYYRNWMKREVWAARPVTHESYLDYFSRGCRCDVCTGHMRTYGRDRRLRFKLLGLTTNGTVPVRVAKAAPAAKRAKKRKKRRVTSTARVAAWTLANPERARARKVRYRERNRERLAAIERDRYRARKSGLITPTLEVITCSDSSPEASTPTEGLLLQPSRAA